METCLLEAHRRQRHTTRIRTIKLTFCILFIGLVVFGGYKRILLPRMGAVPDALAAGIAPEIAEELLEPPERTTSIPLGQFWHTLQTAGTRDALAHPSEEKVAEQPQEQENNPPEGLPVRIKIPRLSVDARIEEVTLTADGAMDIPKRPQDTAWYALGPRPGEVGSATIAGHVDWKSGARGVFADLHTLQAGDSITVENDEGVRTTFVVRTSQEYDPQEDAAKVFFSYDGSAHLNLVTCAGTWDQEMNMYSKRLVVFADKIDGE
jgi:sortase (surface protein transpeptidase)